MKYLTLLFLLGMAGGVGAQEAWQSDDIWTLAEASANPETDDITRSRVNAKIRFLRTKIQEAALDKKVGDSTPTVIIGSMTWTMDNFISSGKLCDVRGFHLWQTVAMKTTLGWGQVKRCRVCHNLKINPDVFQEEP